MSASRAPNALPNEISDDVSHIREVTSGEGLLAQLQRGEIDAEQYIEARIHKALEGLQGLGEEQLAYIKDTLRHQIEEDPRLSKMLDTVLAASPSRVA